MAAELRPKLVAATPQAGNRTAGDQTSLQAILSAPIILSDLLLHWIPHSGKADSLILGLCSIATDLRRGGAGDLDGEPAVLGRGHARVDVHDLNEATRIAWQYLASLATVRYVIPTKDQQLSEVRKGVLAYCVLARLNRESSYGFQLAADLAQFGHLFQSGGALYPLLSRLRRQGWVDAEWVESPQGPPRRYYTVTQDGHNALALFMENWGTFSREVDACIKGESGGSTSSNE